MNSSPKGTPHPGGRQGPIKYPLINDPFGLVGRALTDQRPVEIHGPSRKIPTKYASLSGFVPFQGMLRNVWFESSLERDLLISLKPFDGRVGILEQPVWLNCKRLGFERGKYRPDDLVWDRRGLPGAPRPALLEVKYEDELKAKWPELRNRILAGRCFARRQGWRFLLVTDRHLRIDRPLPRVGSKEAFRRYDLRDSAQILLRLLGCDIAGRPL